MGRHTMTNNKSTKKFTKTNNSILFEKLKSIRKMINVGVCRVSSIFNLIYLFRNVNIIFKILYR